MPKGIGYSDKTRSKFIPKKNGILSRHFEKKFKKNPEKAKKRGRTFKRRIIR